MKKRFDVKLDNDDFKKLDGDYVTVDQLRQPIKVDTNSTKCFIKYVQGYDDISTVCQITGHKKDLLMAITNILSNFIEESNLPANDVFEFLYKNLR